MAMPRESMAADSGSLEGSRRICSVMMAGSGRVGLKSPVDPASYSPMMNGRFGALRSARRSLASWARSLEKARHTVSEVRVASTEPSMQMIPPRVTSAWKALAALRISL
jgi:hypothetical protein